jgi:hypothetical protein
LPVDTWTLHEHSISFRTRHLVRPRTERFIDHLNAWLQCQPGLVDVRPLIERDWHGVVKGATLTYASSSVTQDVAFRIFRMPLTWRGSGLGGSSVAQALNDWGEANPTLVRAHHQTWGMHGRPLECWITAMGPRADIPAAGPALRIRERGPSQVSVEMAKLLTTVAVVLTVLSLIATLTNSWPVMGPLALAASIWTAIWFRRTRHQRR